MPTDGLIDTSGRIETPEHITFEYRLAGPWRRLWAYVIDACLRLMLLMLLLFGLLFTAAATSVESMMDANAGLYLVAYFVIEWFYFVLFEWLWNGQTPGKRALALRVVRDGGYPVGFRESFLRNLLRGADLLPPVSMVMPTYLVGALVSFSDARFRRLGDLAAGTMVVAEEPARLRTPVPVQPPPLPAELARVPANPRLSVEEKRTLEAFLRRFHTLHPDRREELCGPYARHLAARLGSPPPESGARFLQLVYVRMAEAAAPVKRGLR